MTNSAERVRALLAKTPGYEAAQLEAVEHIAGDCSGRRYFRLHTAYGPTLTVVAVCLAHEYGPVAHGGEGLNQDDTFVVLSRYFSSRGVRVPKVLHDARSEGWLVVEDVGDLALWHFAFDQLTECGLKLERCFDGDAAVPLFQRASDVIGQIQDCSVVDDCVAFGRYMGFQEFRTEARRFVDHYLVPNAVSQTKLAVVDSFIDELSEACAGHPRVLIHRDFMPWNLHVLEDGNIAVLDFQDALLGSYAYDLVALIHDRDADFALGKARSRKVVEHFKARQGLGAEFDRHYCECLVQRYLRLAGQFRLLTQKTGRPIYEGWVPGCLRRVGQTLVTLADWREPLEILCDLSPHVRDGANDPMDFSVGSVEANSMRETCEEGKTWR